MIPDILPPTVLTTMEFMMIKVLTCLWVMEDVDIGILRPATLSLGITEVIDTLSNTTLCGHKYLHIHVLLNNWITLIDDMYIY